MLNLKRIIVYFVCGVMLILGGGFGSNCVKAEECSNTEITDVQKEVEILDDLTESGNDDIQESKSLFDESMEKSDTVIEDECFEGIEELEEDKIVVSSLETESSLIVSDKVYNGTLTKNNNKIIFKASLKEDAILEYLCLLYGNENTIWTEWKYTILDGNGNEIWGHASHSIDSNRGYEKLNWKLCLQKGDYYFVLYNMSMYDIPYEFMIGINYPQSTEVYPNGNCSNAQDFDLSNTQYGMLGYNDVNDTYKLFVPADGSVNIYIKAEYISNYENIYVDLYDNNGNKVSVTSSLDSDVYEYGVNLVHYLKKGNYYIQIGIQDGAAYSFPYYQTKYSFDVTVPKEKHIKGKCQMPYWGEGGGYLIGFETYDNPNNEYYYEMFVMDLTLYAQGLPCWVHRTGMARVPECALWTIWQPQYGYYLTLFRLYDKDGNIIDEDCYGFANAY